VALLTLALILTSVFAGAWHSASEKQEQASGAAAYAAEPVKTQVDYFADVYSGLQAGHIFESVTWERLQYTLGYKAGSRTADNDNSADYASLGWDQNYVIVFGGPENASSQAALPIIDEIAKEYNVPRIYHFDPRLAGDHPTVDGPVLDISSSSNSVWSQMWDYSSGSNAYGLKTRLKTVDPAYTSDKTYIFIYNKNNAGGADPIVAEVLSSATDLSGSAGTAYRAQLRTLFETVATQSSGVWTSNIGELTFFDYYQYRVNHITAVVTAGVDVVGVPDSAREGFTVQTVTYPELVHILESPGDYIILFGGTWCPYTSPAVNTINTYAKQNGIDKIYMFDLRLDGNNTAGHIRDKNASYNGGYPYLYGDLIQDHIFNLELDEEGALKEDPVPFYPHNDSSKELRLQQRIGVPFALEYNKDRVDENGDPAPVVSEWIGYDALSDLLYPLAFQSDSVKIFKAYPSAVIDGVSGSVSPETGAAYTWTPLGRHVDPSLDENGVVSTTHEKLTRVTVALPAFNEFFIDVKQNREGYVDPYTQVPPGSPEPLNAPTDNGGCGTGSNAINPVREDRILGENGTSDYDVSHYDIQLSYSKPIGTAKGGYSARTTVTATASKSLAVGDYISFDLRDDVSVNSVKVDGINAIFESTAQKIKVRIPNRKIQSGSTFAVQFHYHAFTNSYQLDGHHTHGLIPSNNSDGATAFGLPDGAEAWFPSNNNLSDRATYDIYLTSPLSLTSVSNGTLVSRVQKGTFIKSHWKLDVETLPYVIFASFGNYYEFKGEVTLSDGTVIPSYGYVDKSLYDNGGSIAKATAYDFAKNIGTYIRWAEKRLGKYPNKTAGFVFESLEDVEYNLQTRDRPLYNGIPNATTFLHEFIHQWLGNSAGIDDWDDLWLQEGLAVYLSNLYLEETGLFSGDTAGWYKDWFEANWDTDFWGLAPADPLNAYNLLGNGVYGRGSYALAALRVLIGDEDFTNTLKTVISSKTGKAISTDYFISTAEEVSGRNLSEFSAAWLYGTVKPTAFPTAQLDKYTPGSVIKPSSVVLDGGSAVTLPTFRVGQPIGTLPTPTKDGYTFDGWYVDGQKIDAAWIVPSTPFTLVARWTKKTQQSTVTTPTAVGKSTDTVKPPAKTKFKKVKAGKKKVTLKWTPAKGISGQQIGYKLKTAKKWKTVKLSAKAKSKVIKKLKKGKRYQFRIRSYKTVSGVKYYSAWSKAKTVKVK
jgi:uncharacterized repeat protein (TIGR02543 family)